MIISILYKYWLKLIGRYDKIYPWDAPKNNDPVKYCDVYKKLGCSHVDGYLCNFPKCSILIEYKDGLERSNKLKRIINVTKNNTKF